MIKKDFEELCLSPRVEEPNSEVNKKVRTWTTVSACNYITAIYLFTPPPLGQDMTQGQYFKRSLTGLN